MPPEAARFKQNSDFVMTIFQLSAFLFLPVATRNIRITIETQQ